MKKIIIVLLITVLVAGFAFAGKLTGSAGIAFFVDLNDKESADHAWGFKNTTEAKYTFSFEFDSTKVAIGEDHQTDVWAELAAEASATVALSSKKVLDNTVSGTGALEPKYTAKITKANIHVGEITFGILNAGKAADFAASYYDDDADGAPDFNVVTSVGTAPGFTVSYKDWNGGFGAKGNWGAEDTHDDNTYAIFAHVETPTFKFANDQVTVDAGAYAFVMDKNLVTATLWSNFGGGFKAAYAADKISAYVGTDLQYIAIPDNEKFAFEVAAGAAYDFVSLDVYLAPGAFFDYPEENPLKLDALLYAAYTFDLSDDIALDVDGYVEVRDALYKDDFTLYVGSSQSTSYKAFTFALAEDAILVNLINDDDLITLLDITARVDYKHEKFDAYVKLTPSFVFDTDDATDTFYAFGLEAGISSTAIVEGAKLALVYKNVDLIDFSANRGLITASCTINF